MLVKGMRKEDPDWDVEEVREEEEEVVSRGKENRGRRSRVDTGLDVARKRRKQMEKNEESEEEADEESSNDGDSVDEFVSAIALRRSYGELTSTRRLLPMSTRTTTTRKTTRPISQATRSSAGLPPSRDEQLLAPRAASRRSPRRRSASSLASLSTPSFGKRINLASKPSSTRSRPSRRASSPVRRLGGD